MKKLVLTFYFVFYILYAGFSQNPLVKEWDKRFGGDTTEWLTCFQKTDDGGYILGGYSYSGISGDKTQNLWGTSGDTDYWIVKTDSLGNKEWNKDFGGTDLDWLYSIQQTNDRGYILAGTSLSGISGDKTQASKGIADYWIVKIDSLGIKLWDKDYGGAFYDKLYSCNITADGGYILGGYSSSGISGDKTQDTWGGTDYWIVKIDSLGNKQWDKDFGGVDNESIYSIQQTNDKGYILGGTSLSGISGNKTQAIWGLADYWIIKTDSLGNFQWDQDFGGTLLDLFSSLQQTIDGGYILGGFSRSDSSGNKTQNSWGSSDYWIIKTDSLGNKQWDKDFGGTGTEDEFGNITQTSDGGYLISGASYSDSSGDKTENNLGPEQTWIIKADSLGNKQWDKTIFTTGHDELGVAFQLQDGCYGIANWTDAGIGGYKTQPSQGNYDYWIIKFCDSTATTGINNFQIPTTNFQIFPNPANDFINISFTSAEEKNVRVEIFDLLGREVFRRKLQIPNSNFQTKINITDFENGIYIIELKEGNNLYKAKIVKM